MNRLEETIVAMLSPQNNDKSRPFYAHLIQCMNRSFSTRVPTAGVYVTSKGVNLLVNREWFDTLDLPMRMEVLEHECGHILRKHIARSKEGGHNPKMYNLASDACINESLSTLHEMGVTVAKIREAAKNAGLQIEVEDNQTSEYYYNIISQIKQTGGGGGKGQSGEGDSEAGDGMGETIDDHSVWADSEDLSPETMDEICKSAIKKAGRKAGTVPYEVQAILERHYGDTQNWRSLLRQFVTKVNKFSRQNTRKKRNRRYGLIYPGKKKKPNFTIVVPIDESGSVSNENFTQFMAEVDKIVEAGAEVKVMQFDTQVNAVYDYKKGMEIKRTGCGGTLYAPVLEEIRGMDVDGIIFFGDGDCFEDKESLPNPKLPVLWALNQEGRENPSNFGRVCYVSDGYKNRA